MAYPRHWLLAFGGGLGDTTEIWSCGIRMGLYSVDPLEGVDEEAYLDATARPGLEAWFENPGARISSAASLTWIKFNEIAPDGTYADGSVTHQRVVTGVVGGTPGTTNIHPLQVCCVLRWRTDAVQRGPASNGRIYSPRPAVAVGTTGDVAGPERVIIAETARDLLNSLDAGVGIIGGVVRPSIVSPIGPGHIHQINAVTVDSALDIQRRRAAQQSRETTTIPVVYT